MERLRFNYLLQVWYEDEVVQNCDHPYLARVDGPCCNSNRYAGMHIDGALALDEEKRLAALEGGAV